MSGIFKNPLSTTNLSRKSISEKNSHKSVQIILGEVVRVVYDGANEGLIYYRSSETNNVPVDSESELSNTALPMFPNIRTYPVKGETVFILRSEIGYFYITPVNIVNGINSNQLGVLSGINSDENNIKLDSNDTFEPDDNIKSTKNYEGDIVFQGRFGQSIKFGSTNKHNSTESRNIYSISDLTENGDPITMIRNGIVENTENINLDASSIYLCSTQKIKLDINNLDSLLGSWTTINVDNKDTGTEASNEVITDNLTTSVDITPVSEPNISNQVDTSTEIFVQTGSYEQTTGNGDVSVTESEEGFLKKPYTISKEGLKKLIQEEGSRYKVYDDKTGKTINDYSDAIGYPTIGVGHLIKKNEYNRFRPNLGNGVNLTESEVQKLLLEDLQPRINALNNLIQVDIKQNMFDALLSMGFNTGFGNKFFKSALNETNNKNFNKATDIIRSGPKTSNGKLLAGLERRRNNEANLYSA